jgi:hypothetical protein
MTDKATLHPSIEELPESELLAAERFLAYLRDTADPVRRALLNAPWDDEPQTDEERQAVQDAREELTRGDTISDADLWQRLGHDPPLRGRRPRSVIYGASTHQSESAFARPSIAWSTRPKATCGACRGGRGSGDCGWGTGGFASPRTRRARG